jgi:phosphoesterase RecJ-like protein
MHFYVNCEFLITKVRQGYMSLEKRFLQAIDGASNILITTHSFPDADGIGSQISLCMALRSIGKKAICVNEEPLLERYRYLDPDSVVIGLEEFKADAPEKPDLIIVVDTNTIARTGAMTYRYASETKAQLLYVDHHPCDESLQLSHCVDTSYAATGELVGHLIEEMGVEFDHKMALPLYTAILIDTSSFRYPTVSARTHRMISKLMDSGIHPPEAYNGIYGTKKLHHMHLLGKVLSSADSNKAEDIAWIVLRKADLIEHHIDIEDTHAFINHLLILDNIKVACMFREDDGEVKVSLRSSGQYDVGKIAISLGGGGHSHSAATIIKKDNEDEDINEIIWEVVHKVENLLKSYPSNDELE